MYNIKYKLLSTKVGRRLLQILQPGITKLQYTGVLCERNKINNQLIRP